MGFDRRICGHLMEKRHGWRVAFLNSPETLEGAISTKTQRVARQSAAARPRRFRC